MILIIAEKPSVAFEIAKIVGANKQEKGYLTGNDYIVSWCLGHLVELAQPSAYREEYEVWSLDTLPIIPTQYLMEVSTSKADQYRQLKKLIERNDITELVEATDAGREGELIFRLVYEMAGCKKPFKRLWISSMEEKSIRHGLDTMKSGVEYDCLYQAALCRQKADWLLGINLTRLYSKMYDKTLTCGRVQTPTINMIVQRQRQIDCFEPQTYFTLTAECDGFQAYAKVKSKMDAQQIIEKCSGKQGIVTKIDTDKKTENPPALYDLTTLQRDANRLLGYSAKQTLDHLQSLYDKKLATYPRTDSRYITEDQKDTTNNLIRILFAASIFSDSIMRVYHTEKVDITQIVNDKKVTDHHAILPTERVTREKLEQLSEGERNILLLISYCLLSAVYTSHSYITTTAELDIEGQSFIFNGRQEIDLGFEMVDIYLKQSLKYVSDCKTDILDPVLPPMNEGDTFIVQNLTAKEKKTKPRPSFTEDTLLHAMETAGKDIADVELKDAMKGSGLGTPATRAGIIENIIKTGYVRREGKKLLPTQMAYTFMDLLPDCIKEAELTASWEKQLAEIQNGSLSADVFMQRITEFLKTFVADTKAQYVSEQSKDVFASKKEYVAVCPKCGKGVIEYPKSFACESGKNSCGFVIWKTIAGKTLTKAQAIKLLTKGKTPVVKGFTTSKTGKLFDACLVLKEDNTIGFEFPRRK